MHRRRAAIRRIDNGPVSLPLLPQGTFVYEAKRHECPRCGSRDVQFALGIEELPDDDPLIEVMRRLIGKGGEYNKD